MAANVVALRAEQAGEVAIDLSSLPPLLPEGEYRAVLTYHETAVVFSQPKVFLHFKIIDPGEAFEKMLYRAYRVKSLTGKPSKHGGFKVARGGDLCEMLCRVLDVRARPDRISVAPLRGSVLKIRLRTVTKDYRQRTVRDWLRYSVVSDIIGMETSSNNWRNPQQ